MATRDILVHYHLFKNAGTSIDRLLFESFGDRWINFDRDTPGARISAAELQVIIDEHPELKAISSHQIVPPVPVGEFNAHPIVMLRDPIDRVRSAWLFEWQKQLHLSEPKGSLVEYINEKLSPGRGAVIANFHVSRLSNNSYDSARQARNLTDQDRLATSRNLLDSLPFFGIVEKFGDSLSLLNATYSPIFSDLVVRAYQENRTQTDTSTLLERHDQLRADIGSELYEELLRRNAVDIELYEYATALFDSRLAMLQSSPATVARAG